MVYLPRRIFSQAIFCQFIELRLGVILPVGSATAIGWRFYCIKMKSLPRYFRNEFQMHTVDADSLWELQGSYMILLNNTKRLKVHYSSHEDWFYEVDMPTDSSI